MNAWDLLEEFVESVGYHGDGSKVAELRQQSDEAFRRLGQIRSHLGRRTELPEFRSWPDRGEGPRHDHRRLDGLAGMSGDVYEAVGSDGWRGRLDPLPGLRFEEKQVYVIRPHDVVGAPDPETSRRTEEICDSYIDVQPGLRLRCEKPKDHDTLHGERAWQWGYGDEDPRAQGGTNEVPA